MPANVSADQPIIPLASFITDFIPYRRLQQAQEAFVYGMPFAAFALMRVVLDLVLTNHYVATRKDLNAKINSANDRLPGEIGRPQLERLRRLGNDTVHIRPKELHKLED